MKLYTAILSLALMSCASTTPPGFLTKEESEARSRAYEAMADEWAGGEDHYSDVGCADYGVCFIIMADGEPVKLSCVKDGCKPIEDYCE